MILLKIIYKKEMKNTDFKLIRDAKNVQDKEGDNFLLNLRANFMCKFYLFI